MKVAFHFSVSSSAQLYDFYNYNLFFKKLQALNFPHVSSKILVGDLLIRDMLPMVRDADELIQMLVVDDTWQKLDRSKARRFLTDNVFVICFETVQKELAEKIHISLADVDGYLGALEIDHCSELHWWLYGECIGSKFRICDKILYIQIDNDDPENQDYANELVNYFQSFLFDEVRIENTNYRYSLFDGNHNFQNARKVAEWKKSTDSLFASVTDEIIAKLTDVAPGLSTKLWAINNTFNNAETGEQYAQAMLSCRRVFEYITDCIFPASNEVIDGHSLKQDKYKNRLMTFANQELRSNTNIDLIVANTASLFDEWSKLYELSNKGVHGEPHRQECRRCILRTVLLLDDIVAIKNAPFEVNVNMETTMSKLAAKYVDDSRVE